MDLADEQEVLRRLARCVAATARAPFFQSGNQVYLRLSPDGFADLAGAGALAATWLVMDGMTNAPDRPVPIEAEWRIPATPRHTDHEPEDNVR